MTLCIFGSRALFDERTKQLIRDEIQKHKPNVIVTSGEVSGVCEQGRQIARELAIPLNLHFLNFRYRKGAFEHRSKAILSEADHVILIHDGHSKGTLNELKLAKKMGVPFTYHLLKQEPMPQNESEWATLEASISE